MQAHEFSAAWIDLDKGDDIANSPHPVMVTDQANGVIYSVTEVVREDHEEGGTTIWIKVEEF